MVQVTGPLANRSHRLVALGAGCAAGGSLLVALVAGAARGCRAAQHAELLDQRVTRVENALGIGDAGVPVSLDAPLLAGSGAPGGASTAACAVAEVAAYRAWQEAFVRAKTLAAPAQAGCADMWSDKKKQGCYYAASAEVRATQAARDNVLIGGNAAGEAVKNVKENPKNEAIARARSASEAAFAACGDEVPP
jgi:hypothetical protein